MPKEYSFGDELNKTRGFAVDESVLQKVRSVAQQLFSDFSNAYSATEVLDKRGVDIWLARTNSKGLGIDLKLRWDDWAEKGVFDLALERWSDVDRQIIGWTLDATKKCDSILWIWPSTERWFYTPFRELRLAMELNSEDWFRLYPHPVQHSVEGDHKWRSQCIYVPEEVVVKAVQKQISTRLKSNGIFTASSVGAPKKPTQSVNGSTPNEGEKQCH